MGEASSGKRILVAALAEKARTRASATDHPQTDQLLDYHAGRLDPKVEQRLQDHLVGCRRCARALLELASLAQPEAGDEEADPADLAR